MNEMFPFFIVSIMCGTGLIIGLVHRVSEVMLANKKTGTNSAELNELRDTMASLECRLENMEAIVAGSEFTTSQTVARALANEQRIRLEPSRRPVAQER